MIANCDGGRREAPEVPTMRWWVMTHPVEQLRWYARLGKRTQSGRDLKVVARQYE